MTPQENKPDFEAIAKEYYPQGVVKESLSIPNDEWKPFINGCDHVWSTFVVPLQEKHRKASEAWGNAIRLCEEQIINVKELESENQALKEENRKLTTTFIDQEVAADHPNENLSHWQYQQFTRVAITQLKNDNQALRDEVERLKAYIQKLEQANAYLHGR